MSQANYPPPTDFSLLVTGASGLLGSAVVTQATVASPSFVTIWGTWHSRRPVHLPGISLVQLDVADRQQVLALVDELRPTAIIHTAYRKDGASAHAVTAQGSRNVAEAAAASSARLVHVSSDVIFDGEHAPYDESALPAPLHDYGRAKAAAEEVVRSLAPASAIVRTSLICRLDPPDRITGWIVDSLRRQQPITLFTDEIRSPVWVQDLAAALLELAGNDYTGIINVAGPLALSRYDMGLRLAQRLGLDPAGITAASSHASGLARPRNCTLDVRLAQRLLRTRLRSYDEGLA